MGSNNGTGQPNWFRCSSCRRYGQRDQGWAGNVTLTGRRRPRRSTKGGARVTHINREYRCSCGHVGWSCHIDLAYKAGEHVDLMMNDDGSTFLPSYARSET